MNHEREAFKGGLGPIVMAMMSSSDIIERLSRFVMSRGLRSKRNSVRHAVEVATGKLVLPTSETYSQLEQAPGFSGTSEDKCRLFFNVTVLVTASLSAAESGRPGSGELILPGQNDRRVLDQNLG
jgi:hypothetical protein